MERGTMKNPFEIMRQVEESYCLPRGSLVKTVRRTAVMSEARAVAIFLCRKHTKFSLHELGEMFLIDHSSVTYALKRIRNTKDVDILELIAKDV